MSLLETGLAVGGAECLRRHGDDMQKAGEKAVKEAQKVIDEGWKQDYEAGGVSSWGSSGKPVTA
jgi:hypothetical protein